MGSTITRKDDHQFQVWLTMEKALHDQQGEWNCHLVENGLAIRRRSRQRGVVTGTR